MNIMVNPGRKIIGRLAKGEDLLAALEKLALNHSINLGEVSAIGAVSQAGRLLRPGGTRSLLH